MWSGILIRGFVQSQVSIRCFVGFVLSGVNGFYDCRKWTLIHMENLFVFDVELDFTLNIYPVESGSSLWVFVTI